MIRDLRAFYVAILDNEVICFETNVAKFHVRFKKIELGCLGYESFYKYFKAKTKFTLELSGKIYHFQKVV